MMRTYIGVMLALLCCSSAWAVPSLETAVSKVQREPGAENDVALIVAIEDYDKAPDIPGARANARLWRQWFRARGTREVRLIQDSDVVHGWGRDGKPRGLLPHLDTAATLARRQGGVLWFVFIGHGAPVFEQGRAQGVLLAHGVQQTVASLSTHGIFVDGDLLPRLARAGKSVAVLDACFSGQSSDGPLVPGLQPLIPAPSNPAKTVTVFTAAKGTEYAGPLPDAQRPAFSYLLLGALAGWADGEVDRKRDRQVTSEEAFEWVRMQMARSIRGRRQTPTMRGPNRVLSKAWSSPGRPPPVQPASEPARPTRSGGTLVAHATRHRPALRFIPAGAFMLGSPADEAGRFDNERQVSMRLDAPFAMMETEVTQAQWEAMMGSQPARFRGGDNPVERVSWYDAIAFANALSKAEQRTPCYVMTACQNRPGSGCNQRGTARSCEGEFRCTVQPQPACTGYRLPSEAEWEYAARAGTTQARYGRLDVIAWHDDNADNTSHPVGRKAANRWDMHDMLGNVSEWTDDGYSRAYQPRSLDPQAYADSSRMVRGGSWCESGRWARAARRGFESPEYRSSEIGFRLVRAVNAAERR